MTNLVTSFFHNAAATNFYTSLTDGNDKNYIFVGRITAWPNDAAPPSVDGSVNYTEFGYWRNVIAAKKIVASDVSFAIKRYNWANNTIYRQYDSTSSTLFADPSAANTLYVMTDDYNVYKCLFNNKAATSTVKPTGTSTSLLNTADGYIWKYMYTVTSADRTKFMNTQFIPIKTLTSSDGSQQWNVQQAASNGSIQVIDIISSGSSYLQSNGTFFSVPTTTTMTLNASASGIDNIYNDSSVFITSGPGNGELKNIVDYNGATKTITINSAFDVTPTTSSTYLIGPKVTVIGDGSTTATAYANTNAIDGSVNKVTMVNVGANYSRADVTVTANTSHGSGATAVAYIPPLGGHGSDAVNEFKSDYVMTSVQIVSNNDLNFPIVNDFREWGLLKNPTLVAGGAVANASSYDLTLNLNLTSVTSSGAFDQDEVITGSVSGATAKVVAFSNTNGASTTGVLKVNYSNGTFSTSDIVTGAGSSVTGLVSSVTNPLINSYTGQLLYLENLVPIEREFQQTEDFKLIVRF